MVMSLIGRRLRLALVGGGPGSFIGETHRIAARLDGHYDLVAAALSSNPQRGIEAARALGIAPERAHPSWQALIEAERRRPDPVDVVAVMTPNDSHHAICMAALDAGFHVICDKPVVNTLQEARELADKVREREAEFCVTYCYSGYPMVRQARDMVRAGLLGEIRQVHLQYVQGDLAPHALPDGWRQDAARSGGSLVLMDIGTHALHLGAYVTGLAIERLCADLGSAVPGRQLDDYVALLMRYGNGARGNLWVTNAAAGSEHGLGFRIHGDLGGLEWQQEEPNRLVHRSHGAFDQVITRRLSAQVSEGARRSTRVGVGHPEGYFEAFANLYTEFAQVVAGRIAGRRQPLGQDLFPGLADGIAGLELVDAAVRSARSGRWETVAER
jgi:predicted dehydrogenase